MTKKAYKFPFSLILTLFLVLDGSIVQKKFEMKNGQKKNGKKCKSLRVKIASCEIDNRDTMNRCGKIGWEDQNKFMR